MNLAWIAAVLQPRDVVRHPNFPSDESNRDGPAQLAGMVLGGDWSRDGNLEYVEGETRRYLAEVEECLRAETIMSAVPTLAEHLNDEPPSDIAEYAAFALMLSVAAAEIDDFATAFRVLDKLLDRMSGTSGTDAALVKASVVQQRALRSRDAGRPFIDGLRQVGALLQTVDPESSSGFPTSAGVAWGSTTTVAGIRVSLLHAASSIWPAASGKPVRPLLERIELVRQPPSQTAVRLAIASESEYARHVAQEFSAQDATGPSRFGSPRLPDLYHPLMLVELVGSGSVYEARRELALLRLVREQGAISTVADALRLLRQAGAKDELIRQLRRLESGGPLAALSVDARQIIRMRLSSDLLRTLEVRVLAAASQILTRTEAVLALDAVIASLNQGGPPSPAGTWELEIVRREVAWAAIAALAEVAGRQDAAAKLLLDEMLQISEDKQIADRAMRTAVQRIGWEDVSKPVKEAWRSWLDRAHSDFAGTAEVVSSRLEVLLDPGTFRSDFDQLVYSVNARLRGIDMPPPIPTGATTILQERMVKRTREIAEGRFSFGGIEEADVAAALVAVGVGNELWPALTDFLVDPRVPQNLKSSAFDRLAITRPELPVASAGAFIARKASLLTAASMHPFDSGVTPNPAALRFLGSYGLLDRAEVYAELAMLAGSAQSLARREAAECVSVLARNAPADELLALALPLSHDADVEVRAQSGKALASLAMHDGVLARVAERRALELLDSDGLRVPLLVVRGLSELGTRIPGSIIQRVREIASQHPSLAVRRAADALSQGSST